LILDVGGLGASSERVVRNDLVLDRDQWQAGVYTVMNSLCH